jgi:hypothetical protein
MKKTILTTTFLLIITMTFGQLGLGIKGGLNLAGQTIKDTEIDISTKMKPGYHAGAYLYYFVKKSSWGIQIEGLYSAKGSDITYKTLAGEFSGKSKLYYIDVPVMVRWQIIKFLNVHAGPQFNILLSAEETLNDVTEDIKEELTSGEFAFAFGAEANLPFRINVTARYIVGFTDIFKGADDMDYSKKNNLLMISLGIRLLGDK